MRLRHLTARFVGALWPAGPKAVDAAWAATLLTEDELRMWSRLPAHDRRHAVRVARAVEQALAGTEHADDARFLEAALVHDIGKLDARLGVFGRVAATLAGATAGHEMAGPWAERRGITRRFGLYLLHPEIGADRIRLAGGSREAAAWARAHHQPDAWPSTGIPEPVIRALAAADDD